MVNGALKESIDKYIKDNKLSKKQMADNLRVHRSSFSQYMNNCDNLSQKTIDTIEEKLCEFLIADMHEENDSPQIQKRPTITKTGDCLGVMAVCQSCQEYMGLGIVVGKTGFGKTYTLKHYSKNKRVCYVECNESMNARDLIKAIERNLSLPHLVGSIDDRLDNIKDFFNTNDGYLLIIDEADKLITRYTQKKAEILRNIYDQSDVGLVLAGEPALGKLIKQLIPRMANRIDFAYELGGINESEVMEYIGNEHTWSAEAQHELVNRATNEKTGCFRLLNRTYENIMRIIEEGEDIGIDTVRKASAMMAI